jgi:hypothetical protein
LVLLRQILAYLSVILKQNQSKRAMGDEKSKAKTAVACQHMKEINHD